MDLEKDEGGVRACVLAAISVQPCLPTQVWGPHSSAECVGTAAAGSTMASTPVTAAAASSRGV